MEGGFESSNETQVCGLKFCTSLLPKKLLIFNITVFEFLGMVLFSNVVITYHSIISLPGVWVVLIGMFFSLALSGTFGCGQLNPAMTFACMIKKERRIQPMIGLYYVFIQILGAFVGTFIAWAFSNELVAPFSSVHSTSEPIWKIFGREIFGSFIFILCGLIKLSSSTAFTKNNFENWVCAPLCLVGVCKIFGLSLGTNPAQALAFQVAFYINSPEDEETKAADLSHIWSVVLGASLGGVIAAIVYENVDRQYALAYIEEMVQDRKKRAEVRINSLNKGLEEPMLQENKIEKEKETRRITNIEIC